MEAHLILVRFRRANGLGATYQVKDDSKLQDVMDAACRHFGDPTQRVPDPLVVIAQAEAKRKKRGNHRGTY